MGVSALKVKNTSSKTAISFTSASASNRSGMLGWIFAAAAALIFIFWTIRYSIHSDEVAHLHAVYYVSQGVLPFKGFWEHHSPFLWVVLSPIFGMLPQSSDVIIWARVLSVILSGGLLFTVWKLSKLFWHEKADLATTSFFFFSAGILSQFSIFRPDAPMLIFGFAFLYFLMRAAGEAKGRYYFFSGFCLALSLSFSPKWVFMLPFAALQTVLSVKKSWREVFKKNLFYMTGVALGALPLTVYLYAHDLFGEYARWVIWFNKKTLEFKVCSDPIFWVYLSLAALCLWFARREKAQSRIILLAAFTVVLFNTFFIYPIESKFTQYYTASFLLFTCVFSSGIGALPVMAKNNFFRAIVLSALFIITLYPNVKNIHDSEKRFAPFSEQIKLSRWLSNEFRGDEVVVVYPWHPIFAKDVGVLQMSAHFDEIRDDKKGLREYLRSRPKWTEEIIDRKPALIAKWELERIIPMLTAAELITRQDYKRFITFLKTDYVPVNKYGATFLLRKGHPAASSADKVGVFTS